MTIRDLQTCRNIRGQIDSLDERITRLRSQAERLSRPLTGLPGGEASDQLAEYAAKLDDLERQRTAQIIALDEQLQTCEDWIETLPTQQARVIRLRYVQGLPWKLVAEKAKYSMNHCKKIGAAAKRKVDTQ